MAHGSRLVSQLISSDTPIPQHSKSAHVNEFTGLDGSRKSKSVYMYPMGIHITLLICESCRRRPLVPSSPLGVGSDLETSLLVGKFTKTATSVKSYYMSSSFRLVVLWHNYFERWLSAVNCDTKIKGSTSPQGGPSLDSVVLNTSLPAALH